MKILAVVIFIILIVLIYVLYKLLSKTTTKVSGFSDASTTITGASQPKTQNNAFSFWFYISSWTSVTGQRDPLIQLNQGVASYMSAKLDTANNTLIIEIKSTNPAKTVATVNITDIRLQKWNHIIISVNGNVVDVYLDGKLVKTQIASEIPVTTLTTNFDPKIGGSGNKGFISSALYKNDYITPEEAWNIYSMGYTGAGLFDFVNRYKLNFSITKDDQEAVSFSV
jgi:hypothetical protein